MNKHSFKIFHAGFAAIVVLLGLNSCSDAWVNHYETNLSIHSDTTLWMMMQRQENLSDFREILDSTHVSSYNNSSTVSYAELLNSEQTFTIWAPINGSFDKNMLLNLCQTDSGQRVVERTFVRNHIARFLFSITSETDKNVIMLNGKEKILKGFVFGDVNITTPNIVTSNGILHILNGKIGFLDNLYEGLFNNGDFSRMASFFKAYQKDSLDEFASVSSGIVDGKTVYVDSVLIVKNALLDELGYLNEEDSSYMVIAPSNTAWDAAYAKIAPYFNFSFITNAAALQDYWAKHNLIGDLIFNTNLQASANDSLVSTQFTAKDPLKHVFHKPYESGGILSEVIDSTVCSNGTFYKVDKWPFSLQKTFFLPLKTEAEEESSILNPAQASLIVRSVIGKGLSNNSYLDVLPTASFPTLTFQVKNTLSGKYDVCVVFVPQSVYKTPLNHADSLDVFRPCRFRATLYYTDASGKPIFINCANGGYFSNNAYKLDTVCVAQGFKFPTCNLNQNEVTVSLKLLSYVTSGQMTTYNREMFIDCVYLKPRED